MNSSREHALIELTDVGRRYGTTWALAHVSLVLPPESIVIVTGPNGAGKTTLLRVMATAVRPTIGRVKIFGHDTRHDLDRARRQLTLLTHDNHFYSDLSGFDNLGLYASLRRAPRSTVDDLLAEVGLAEAAGRLVRDYSAGMKRRLALARVLLAKPKLALLDEPFGQLDPDGVALMERSVNKLREEGATVVISTHDVERGRRLGDHRVLVEAGQLARPLERLAISSQEPLPPAGPRGGQLGASQ